MTTAGAEMLTKKFGVKMDSHLSKEQLAIARAFRSVLTCAGTTRILVRFFVSVPRSGKNKKKNGKKIKKCRGPNVVIDDGQVDAPNSQLISCLDSSLGRAFAWSAGGRRFAPRL